MLPGLTINNMINRHLSYSKYFRQIPLVISFFRVKGSNLANFPIGHFSRTNRLSLCLSSLCDHIADIVLPFSRKQMAWIYAQPVVTFMANKISFSYWAIVDYPRKSMCANIGSFWPFFCKKTIAAPGDTSNPIPAIFSLNNLPPETNSSWSCPSWFTHKSSYHYGVLL